MALVTVFGKYDSFKRLHSSEPLLFPMLPEGIGYPVNFLRLPLLSIHFS